MAASSGNLHELDSLRIARRPESKRQARRRLGFGLLSLILLAGAAAAGYSYLRFVSGRALPVETFMVTAAQTRQPGILLTGTGYVVTSHKYIIVGTKILGQIVEEPIEEGKRVKKGDLLARIDDRDYQAQLRQAMADRDLAEANLKLMQARAERQRELYNAGIISTDDFQTSENAAEVTQAALRRDEAAIDYAKFQVSQCLIVSPIDGVVLQKYRELGDTINYGGQVQAGGGATDIAQLADTQDMRAEVDINESDIAKVLRGMPAMVVPDAYPQSHFEATLVKIYPEADRQKATVKVEVRILRPDLAMIKPEMSVKANFLEKRATDDGPRVFIPAKALVHAGEGSFVWVVHGNATNRIPVQTGGTTENGVEVRNGLHDGDRVIVAPPPGLSEGQRVRSTT